MNKIVFVGVGAAAILIVVAVGLSSVSADPVSELKQILKNKDCVKLVEWEPNLYKSDLNLSSELKQQAFSMAMQCELNALENVFGN